MQQREERDKLHRVLLYAVNRTQRSALLRWSDATAKARQARRKVAIALQRLRKRAVLQV